ncbi:MAG: ARMT1-like domain-containing protein [Verrucomicrobiae bacterium]|nr:ARMT1-like domain-containing protein [Verrucomicrobiae bacterium]
MNTAQACIPCIIRQTAEVLAATAPDPAQKEILMRRILREIAKADWDTTPPALVQRIHRIIKKMTGDSDPYRKVKREMNRMAASLLPELRKQIRSSANPRETAARLAIAGNLLDSGAKTQISARDLPEHVTRVLKQSLVGDVTKLFRAAESARDILYLTDNAGEIFFDRLLIEELPLKKITVAVRGAPVINDATLKDAKDAGLPGLVPVINNGSDAPGTILADCSPEFRKRFKRAELIIAKGQGNYESLAHAGRPNLWFLLTVKCPLVASQLKTPVGSLAVREHRPAPHRSDG